MSILTVGIGLAKNLIALDGVNVAGKVELVRPAVLRDKLYELIALLPCMIGMEACSGSHSWEWLFQASGHTVRLSAPGCRVQPVRYQLCAVRCSRKSSRSEG